MNPTSVHNSSSLASHTFTFSALLNFFISVLFTYSSFAQDTIPTYKGSYFSQVPVDSSSNHQITKSSNQLTTKQINRRVKIIAATNIIGYGAALGGLYAAWYKNYPQSNFHVFNDMAEWKGMDKIGHAYGVYAESLASMELWRWTGVSRKKRIWYGGLSGPIYHTVIEVLDAYSAEWGWSWGDIGANFIGSGMLIAQELAWDEQRIQFKFSFHRKSYNDPTLNQRSNKIFGTSTAERFLKDYNGQTYWLSANIRSFFPQSKWPKWLNIAVGTGAEGMFGANENIGKDAAGNINFNRTDIKRYRQWYLSPDIDLTKIKTNKKGLKLAFRLLNIVKIPMPALEFSNGSFKVKAIGF
ncbi:MAG: DUF2279 domain-containing protein [Chitinophagaceae bacterium]|nr:DUF2279 domain-containing protein [Chitinophagaceae bacterium]